MYKILCVGPQWRGSNAAALFKAFARMGHPVVVLDENYYINLNNKRFWTRVLDKLFFNWHVREFNEAISNTITQFSPDVVVVYKGAFIMPSFLSDWKKKCPVVNVYPDVSFRTHGKFLPLTLPLYNWIFTTKTFGLVDMKKELGIENASFVPHGFDPEIHRVLVPTGTLKKTFDCEVSFIGTYSPKKEKYLTALMQGIPGIQLKVWGNGWRKATSSALIPCLQYQEVLGDLYAMAIYSSKINLGILSESVGGAVNGDLITSRTFHIPAAGGFMLHERTAESVLYYKENEEAVFFESPDELIEQVKYYLEHKEEREKIRLHGMKRAMQESSIDKRAYQILETITSKVMNEHS